MLLGVRVGLRVRVSVCGSEKDMYVYWPERGVVGEEHVVAQGPQSRHYCGPTIGAQKLEHQTVVRVHYACVICIG